MENKSFEESLDVLEGKTLRDIIQKEYRGSILYFCKENNLPYRKVYHLLHGFTAVHSQNIAQDIANTLQRNLQELFPVAEFPRQIYGSIEETPGFQLLKEKHSLEFQNRHKLNLSKLIRSLGFTEGQYISFCHVLTGYTRLSARRKLCMRIATALQCSFNELFPPNIYKHEKNEKYNNEETDQIFIEDEPSAQCLLMEAYTPAERIERIDDMRAFIKEHMIPYVSPYLRTIAWQIWTGEKSMHTAAEENGKTSRSLSAELCSFRNRLQTHFEQSEKMREELNNLLYEKPNTRSRIFS